MVSEIVIAMRSLYVNTWPRVPELLLARCSRLRDCLGLTYKEVVSDYI